MTPSQHAHSVGIPSVDELFLPTSFKRDVPDKHTAGHSVAQQRPWSLAGVVSQWWKAKTQSPKQMRLVETLSMGPKRSVALLELDGHRFLVGMGNDGVTTMLQIETPHGAGDRTR